MFSIDLTYLCRHNIENTAGFNYMNRRYYCMFIVLFFAVLTQAAAAERIQYPFYTVLHLADSLAQ